MTPAELEELIPKFHGPFSAARLLGISYPSLRKYRLGIYPIPRKVADRARVLAVMRSIPDLRRPRRRH